jgi:hypothetical protein
MEIPGRIYGRVKGVVLMTAWTSDELTRIGTAEELEIASLREDGTLRKPVTIWAVRLGDDLYVRPMYGRASVWFRATHVRHAGHIQAGGIDKDVTFVDESDPDINNQIDAVYRTKYGRYGASTVGSVVSPESKAATLKLLPR